MSQFPAGQTLLIDADDTLWENNIYFERAIASFIGYLNHQAYSREQVRDTLNGVERESILAHGYGLHSFTHSLITCFERLSAEPDGLVDVGEVELRGRAASIRVWTLQGVGGGAPTPPP